MYTTKDPIANTTELRTPPAIILATAFERDNPVDVNNVDIVAEASSEKPLMQLNTAQVDSTSTKFLELMY